MFYRAYLQREYSGDRDNWIDQGWDFFTEDPTEYVKGLDKMGAQSTYESSRWRIKYLHIISEEDYKNKKIYTKPIEQIIFH